MRITAILTALIAIAGISGALIGYAIVDISCHGSCTVARTSGGLIGLAIAAAGVGIVGTLVIRAIKETPRSRKQ